MSKERKRGNREIKKPKATTKPAASSPALTSVPQLPPPLPKRRSK
jgi:hypothetical protein